MVPINSNQSYTGLVEKYIGTAYDKVASVADNLGSIIQVEKDIEQFVNKFYGPLEEVPVTKPNGMPSEPSDVYYSIPEAIHKVFTGEVWAPYTFQSKRIEHHIIDATHVSGDTTTIEMRNTYSPHSSSLMVTLGGVFQKSVSEGDDGDYVEYSPSTIVFPEALVEGEKVTITISSGYSSTNPTVSARHGHTVSDSPTQTDVMLPEGMSYMVGHNGLVVYIDGNFLSPLLDYTEVTATQIRLTSPVGVVGAVIAFQTAILISNSSGTEIVSTSTPTLSLREVHESTDATIGHWTMRGSDTGYGIRDEFRSADRIVIDMEGDTHFKGGITFMPEGAVVDLMAKLTELENRIAALEGAV